MYNIYNIDEYEESNGVVLTLMTSAKKTKNTEKNIEKTQAMISAALLGVTAVGLIVTWIAFGQTPLRMLPLFVSLVVGDAAGGSEPVRVSDRGNKLDYLHDRLSDAWNLRFGGAGATCVLSVPACDIREVV